jgi:hypothetical protein
MATRIKAQYTEKEKGQAERIKQRYVSRGVPLEEAERRASATVHDIAGGGRKGGSASGRAKKLNTAPAKASGRIASPTSATRRRLGIARAARGPSTVNHGPTSGTRAIQEISEGQARQLICRQFARMAARGYGKFRARWFPEDQRLQFQGEKANRWESVPNGDYHGENARLIAAVLESIRAKRNSLIEVRTHVKPDQITFEVRVPPAAVETHRSALARFLEGQLFWD